MFLISAQAIDVDKMSKELMSSKSGAFVSFEGLVRNHNDGKEVEGLEYEIFEALALKEAQVIIEEAKAKFDVIEVSGAHRMGSLKIGERAVWVGCTAAHRDAAFAACRHIIDEIKHRLPVWKKEQYISGESQWVNCQGCHQDFRFSEQSYYDKQIRLSTVGEGGQEKLRKARVLVIGAGGLGCSALTYLASAGVGHIGILDSDKLESSNLHRQTLYNYEDIGKKKAELAKIRLNKLNPFIAIETFVTRLVIANAQKLISSYDIVLDCTDNFETKFLVHDACYLFKIPLVQASVYQYEGQIQLYAGDVNSGCLRCLWPDLPEESCTGSCEEVGILGVVPGVLGSLQASETLKLILNLHNPAATHTILVDLMSLETNKILRPRQIQCPLCGDEPSIKCLEIKNYSSPNEWRIELSNFLDSELQDFQCIDIRETSERNEQDPWESDLHHIPFSKFERNQKDEWDFSKASKPILLICQRGARSARLAKNLREAGHDNVYSLARGIEAIKENWERFGKRKVRA